MADHTTEAHRAKEVYQARFSSESSRRDWHAALRNARAAVGAALRSSEMLYSIEAALVESGRHMLVFRHLMAPPMSQDQFKLLAPSWSKGTEKSGKGLDTESSMFVAKILLEWIDHGIASWLSSGQQPRVREIRQLYERAASLIAYGRFYTDRRTQISSRQEQELLTVLERKGWQRIASRPVVEQSTLSAKQFMHKTKFATRTLPQEVDVACGLGKSCILAVECKVTNDETNSVKRVNDVIKKAGAWKDHWGNFVKTAALLQGVIKPADVQRLIAADVVVFWSHDLDSFERWIDANVST